jgi:hypothetical protein
VQITLLYIIILIICRKIKIKKLLTTFRNETFNAVKITGALNNHM